jgi:hypothetical protein
MLYLAERQCYPCHAVFLMHRCKSVDTRYSVNQPHRISPRVFRCCPPISICQLQDIQVQLLETIPILSDWPRHTGKSVLVCNMPVSSVCAPMGSVVLAHLMQVPHGSWDDGVQGQTCDPQPKTDYAKSMQCLCNVYAIFMQSLCNVYVKVMQWVCNVYAKFMPPPPPRKARRRKRRAYHQAGGAETLRSSLIAHLYQPSKGYYRALTG